MVYEIISCARDTQLHTFPALEQLGSSPHVNSNGSDCHFFSTKLFLRANKNWGVEMMRIKDVDGKRMERDFLKLIRPFKRLNSSSNLGLRQEDLDGQPVLRGLPEDGPGGVCDGAYVRRDPVDELQKVNLHEAV